MVGFTGTKQEFRKVVDLYFEQRLAATAPKTAFEKAFLALSDVEKNAAKAQLSRLLVTGCVDTKVDEKCVANSISKVSKYSILIKGVDGNEIARGYGLAALPE